MTREESVRRSKSNAGALWGEKSRNRTGWLGAGFELQDYCFGFDHRKIAIEPTEQECYLERIGTLW